MWQAGFVAEVRSLEAAGLRRGRTASRALGYAQVLRFLDGGWSQEQAAAETVRATRRSARRQESWFRRDPRVVWLPAAGGDHGSADLSSEDLADRALDTIRACGLPRATERETTS
jgi:tRNA dimethylallyltransferase